MRGITVVYYSDAPFYGGAEYYLYLLAAGLPRDEFNILMDLAEKGVAELVIAQKAAVA